MNYHFIAILYIMTISGLDHNCNTCASSLRPAGILLHSINRRQMYKCTEASKTSIVSKLASEESPACSKNCLLGCLDVLEVLGGSSRKLNLWLFRHIRNRCYDQRFSRTFQRKEVFL